MLSRFFKASYKNIGLNFGNFNRCVVGKLPQRRWFTDIWDTEDTKTLAQNETLWPDLDIALRLFDGLGGDINPQRSIVKSKLIQKYHMKELQDYRKTIDYNILVDTILSDFNCEIINKNDVKLKNLVEHPDWCDKIYDRDIETDVESVLKRRLKNINSREKSKHPILCIDGCSGSGKSTGLQLTSEYLMYEYFKNNDEAIFRENKILPIMITYNNENNITELDKERIKIKAVKKNKNKKQVSYLYHNCGILWRIFNEILNSNYSGSDFIDLLEQKYNNLDKIRVVHIKQLFEKYFNEYSIVICIDELLLLKSDDDEYDDVILDVLSTLSSLMSNKPNFTQIVVSSLSRDYPTIFETRSRRPISYITNKLLSSHSIFDIFKNHKLFNQVEFQNFILSSGGLPRFLEWIKQSADNCDNMAEIRSNFTQSYNISSKCNILPDNYNFLSSLLRQRQQVSMDSLVCPDVDIKWKTLVEKSYVNLTKKGVYFPPLLLESMEDTHKSIQEIISLFKYQIAWLNVNFYPQAYQFTQKFLSYHFVLLSKLFENQSITIGNFFNMSNDCINKYIPVDLHNRQIVITPMEFNDNIKELLPTKDSQVSQMSDTQWSSFASGNTYILLDSGNQQGIDAAFVASDKMFYCQFKNEINANRSMTSLNGYVKKFDEARTSENVDPRLARFSNNYVYLLIWRTKSPINNMSINDIELEEYQNKTIILHNEKVIDFILPICRTHSMFLDKYTEPESIETQPKEQTL